MALATAGFSAIIKCILDAHYSAKSGKLAACLIQITKGMEIRGNRLITSICCFKLH